MFETGGKTVVIGERINPTGRARLAEELRAGKLDMALEDAGAQAEAGADYIDVNVGAPGVDEVKLLPRAVREVAERTGLPVCVDSADPAALAAALAVYAVPEALVNSTTADDESMEAVLPLVEKTGCRVIALTKDKGGIPATAEERLARAERILRRAGGYGITPDRILIDCLTIPASTDPEAARVTLRSIELIREKLGCPVALGASNISFGMPERTIINGAFLALAINAGLSAAIVNPLEPGLVLTIRAADFLLGKDRMGRAYLKHYRSHRD